MSDPSDREIDKVLHTGKEQQKHELRDAQEQRRRTVSRRKALLVSISAAVGLVAVAAGAVFFTAEPAHEVAQQQPTADSDSVVDQDTVAEPGPETTDHPEAHGTTDSAVEETAASEEDAVIEEPDGQEPVESVEPAEPAEPVEPVAPVAPDAEETGPEVALRIDEPETEDRFEPAPGTPAAAAEDLTPLVEVPAGSVRFGAVAGDRLAQEDERPAVEVRVEAFYLEEHPVTNEQYKRFIEATGYPHLPQSDDPGFTEYDWDSEARTYPEGRGEFPVVNVSRADAEAYAEWAGRRLPTEAEWERAARAEEGDVLYPWGTSVASRAFANYDSGAALPVASFAPNAYGLFDMAGNVFTWTADPYISDLHDRLADGAAYHELRRQSDASQGERGVGVLRGSAFYSTARESRISYREYNSAAVRYPGYGFRLAADERR